MDGLEPLLRLLVNEREWTIPDLARNFRCSEQAMRRICELLSDSGLVFFRRGNHIVRIDPKLRELMLELEKLPY